MAIKTVGDLVAELLKRDQGAELRLTVAWAGDTAAADRGGVSVRSGKERGTGGDAVYVDGWLSGCDTALEINEDAERP
jgi:hypothetical protein